MDNSTARANEHAEAHSYEPEHHGHGIDDHHPHIVPIPILLAVFAFLIVMTILTVAVTYVDLGSLNIWIALAVAAFKAAAVALWFMHLRYDNPFLGQILIGSFFFVALFIGIAMLDATTYQVHVKQADAAAEASP